MVRQAAEEWAALASSQGQSREPIIIIAGDLNTPRDAFTEAMQELMLDEDVEIASPCTGNLCVLSDRKAEHCSGLPVIRGPDNQHQAAFMKVSLFEQFAYTTQVGLRLEHIERDVQEQAAKARQSSRRCKDDPAMAIVAINDGNRCHRWHHRWQRVPSMMAMIAISDIIDGGCCHQ